MRRGAHSSAGRRVHPSHARVEEVHQQPLDVEPVMVLVCHDHHSPIPQPTVRRRDALVPEQKWSRSEQGGRPNTHGHPPPCATSSVRFVHVKAEDGDKVGDFLVPQHRLHAHVPHVQQLPSQRKHAESVSAYNGQASNSKRLRRVSFRQDECALSRASATCVVSILELRDGLQLFGGTPSDLARNPLA